MRIKVYVVMILKPIIFSIPILRLEFYFTGGLKNIGSTGLRIFAAPYF